MQDVSIPAGHYACVVGPCADPVTTVTPCETFAVATVDAFENCMSSPDDEGTRNIQPPLVNPVTARVYLPAR